MSSDQRLAAGENLLRASIAGIGRVGGQHGILADRDIRASGTTEIEYRVRSQFHWTLAKIAGHEAAQVFREGHTQIAGTPARTAGDEIARPRYAMRCRHDVTDPDYSRS